MEKNKFKVVILGGGTGGISLAAKLCQQLEQGSVAIVEPSDKHYYQPMWTIAGAGLADKEPTEKNEKDLIPDGATWFKEHVLSVHPEQKTVQLTNDRILSYEYLVVATGLLLNWDQIEGLKGNLGTKGICSIYKYDQVDYTAEQIQNFKGGTAVFVMPPVPIKCAGAPQKIMYLAENIFRNNGVRLKSEIIFVSAGKAMFGIPTFSDALKKQVDAKGIKTRFMHKLVGVNAENQEAYFDEMDNVGQFTRRTIKFDLLHVVPSMSPHGFLAEAGLSATEGDQKGWLAVDKWTLQHLKYPNIFGIGDVTGVPNSKTAAAIRKQYPIVAKNLLSVMKGEKPEAQYDGYSSCPLITEIGKVMLAEFGYDGKLMPTFPLDPAIPRRSYWHLKKDLLPILYWQGMMKGRA